MSLAFLSQLFSSGALRQPDYRRLWVSAACNTAGSSGEQVVVGLLIYRLTGSSAWVGISLAIYYLPLLLVGAPSGALADWMDRRKLLRLLEAGIAVNFAVFGSVVATSMVEVWHLLLMTAISGTLRAVYQPARSSYVFDIVGGDHIVSGLGLITLGTRFGQLLGAMVAGSLMQRTGAELALFLLCASHVVAFVNVSRLRTRGTAGAFQKAPLLDNLREYLREMRHNRDLLVLVGVTAAVEVCGFSFTTALPEFATGTLEMGAEGLGALHAARAVGGIAASVLLAGSGSLTRRGVLFLGVILVFGAGLLALAQAPVMAFAWPAIAVVAAMAVASDVLTQSMMQLSVPDRLRGRAMGAWVFAIGAAPLGHLEMGTLVTWLGVGHALSVNGATLLAIAVLAALAAPRLRRL